MHQKFNIPFTGTLQYDNVYLVKWLIIDITVIDTFAQFDNIACAMSTVLPINYDQSLITTCK